MSDPTDFVERHRQRVERECNVQRRVAWLDRWWRHYGTWPGLSANLDTDWMSSTYRLIGLRSRRDARSTEQ